MPRKGQKLSDEQRRILSECAKKRIGEKNPFYGKNHSDETKKKMSEFRSTHIGWHHSAETKEKIANGNKGRIITENARKKISVANSGRVLTEEHKKKIGDSQKGKKNYWYGKALPWFEKAWETNRNREWTDVQREKARKRMLQFKHSEESKRKIADSNRRRILSESTKQKHRERVQKQIDNGWFGKIYKIETRFGSFVLRSGYEVIAMHLLKDDISIKTVTYEKIKVSYVDENGIKRLTYNDFLINGKKILEVKSKYYILNVPRTRLKIEAMKKYCIENNLEYILWVEDDLGLVMSNGKMNVKKYLQERAA